MPAFLTKFLIGRPLANREAGDTKLRILEGVPAMGLDGLGSAAYGPEAALTVLAGTGAAGLAAIGPITWVILLLLAILYFSYRQTIAAYPTSGGSYTVAKENLGTSAGLLAAAALMLDYMLNVAVGISAGVGALTSAVPPLHAYTLWICLVILLAITVLNLRGTREFGTHLVGTDLSFHRESRLRAGVGRVEGGASGRASRGRHTAALDPARDTAARDLVAAARLRERLHGDDRCRGGQQRRIRVPRAEGAARARHA